MLYGGVDNSKLKMKEAEDKLRSLIQACKENRYSGGEALQRTAFEALNSVQRARQILDEELGTTDIPRQGYVAGPGQSYKGDDETSESHESFGVVAVTKVTGGFRLVGSMVQSLPSCISFRVSRAKRHVDSRLHTERYYHDGRPLLEFRMSTYQFAEMISGMNGVEVPCTLHRVMHVQMDEPPAEVKTPLEQIASDAQKAVSQEVEGEAEFWSALQKLEDDVDTLKLSGKKAGEMKVKIRELRKFVATPKSAVAWAARRLAEESERTVSQAKVEIAAAITNMAQRAGLQKLAEGGAGAFNLLTGKSGEE